MFESEAAVDVERSIFILSTGDSVEWGLVSAIAHTKIFWGNSVDVKSS